MSILCDLFSPLDVVRLIGSYLSPAVVESWRSQDVELDKCFHPNQFSKFTADTVWKRIEKRWPPTIAVAIRELIESGAGVVTGSAILEVLEDDCKWQADDIDIFLPMTEQAFTAFITFVKSIGDHLWFASKNKPSNKQMYGREDDNVDCDDAYKPVYKKLLDFYPQCTQKPSRSQLNLDGYCRHLFTLLYKLYVTEKTGAGVVCANEQTHNIPRVSSDNQHLKICTSGHRNIDVVFVPVDGVPSLQKWIHDNFDLDICANTLSKNLSFKSKNLLGISRKQMKLCDAQYCCSFNYDAYDREFRTLASRSKFIYPAKKNMMDVYCMCENRISTRIEKYKSRGYFYYKETEINESKMSDMEKV